MKNYNFVKKYNRQINIFLALYCVLCLIFLLLFYGFFITPKAYNDNTSVEIHLNFSGQNQEGVSISGQATKTLDTGNGRSIFLFDNNLNFGTPPYQTFLDGFAFLSTETFNITTNSANYNPDWIGPYIDENGTANNYLYNYLISFSGYNSNWNSTYFYNTTVLTYGDGTKTTINRGPSVVGEIEYVTSVEDAIKYLNGDDSVAQKGDPFNPPVTQDNSLPVPQQVSVSEPPTLNWKALGQNSIPTIQASWVNPSNFGEDDLSNLEVQVKYQPTFKAYSAILGIPKGKFTTSTSDILTININNPNNGQFIDHYITYMDIPASIVLDNNGFNKTFSSYEDESVLSLVNDTLSSNGLDSWGANLPNHTNIEFIKGTKFSIRYKLGNRVSYWVDVNYSGNNVTSNDTSFSDNDNNAVDSEDVNYQYAANSKNPDDDSITIFNFFDKLSDSLNDLFNTSENYFANAKAGTGQFYNFFKEFWDLFPAFFALFLLGLLIAIILRIFGR